VPLLLRAKGSRINNCGTRTAIPPLFAGPGGREAPQLLIGELSPQQRRNGRECIAPEIAAFRSDQKADRTAWPACSLTKRGNFPEKLSPDFAPSGSLRRGNYMAVTIASTMRPIHMIPRKVGIP
jgi:hypothetical protein